MIIHWEFPAQTYFDQLPPQEQAKVTWAIERLANQGERESGNQLHRLVGPSTDDQAPLYALRAGSDLRLVLRKEDEGFTIVDVVRYGQIDGLQRLRRSA